MRWFLPAGILVLLLLLPVGATHHILFGPTAPVFVVTTPAFPEAGHNVTLDVFTHEGGQRQDADEIPRAEFAVFERVRLVNWTPVELQRTGTGHYQGVVRLPEPGSSSPRAAELGTGFVSVRGNMSGEPFTDLGRIDWLIPGVSVRVRADPLSPALGGEVTVAVQVIARGVPVDPTTLSVEVHISSESPLTVDLKPVRVRTGLYRANFTLPSFRPAYASVTIAATATYGPAEVSDHLPLRAALHQLWFRGTFANETEVRGDLWVADPEGRPVEGVPVTLKWFGPACPTPCTQNGTTDAGGRVSGDWTFRGRRVEIQALVGEGARENLAAVTLWIPSQPGSECAACPTDPPLMPDGTPRDLLRPDVPSTRGFRLVDRLVNRSGVPYTHRPVDWYVWTQHAMIHAGQTVTDGEGRLQVTFTPPPGETFLGFALDRNITPAFVRTFQTASPLLGLRVDRLNLGAPTVVEGTLAADLERVALALPSLRLDTSIVHLSSGQGETWERWTPPPTSHRHGLPPFLPMDGAYLVTVSLVTNRARLTQFAVLGVGESADIPVGGGPLGPDILLWVGLGATTGAVVAGIAVFRWMRRRPQAATPLDIDGRNAGMNRGLRKPPPGT